MLTYIARRLVGVLPVIFLVTLMVFTLNSLIPGDPGRIRLGQRADPDQVDSWNFKRGYHASFLTQYLRYLGILPNRVHVERGNRSIELDPNVFENLDRMRNEGAPLDEWEAVAERHGLSVDAYKGQPFLFDSSFSGVLQGQFGESDVKGGKRVIEIIGEAFRVTLRLALGSILIAILLGVGAGIISAVKCRTWLDYTSMVLAIVGVSLPVFWLGILMIIYVAPVLGLPRTGFDSSSFVGMLRSLALPCTALGLISSATIARLTRSAMLDVLTQDYVRTARAKGLREGVVIMRHALRNASIPIVTVVGNSFGYLLVGAVLTESVFALPGLGRTIVESIVQRDRMVITGGILVMSVVFVLVNLLVDLSYGFFDPRVRHGRG